MTTINFTYTVVAVNERTLDVEYTNPDYGTVLVGVRKPKLGESLEQVILDYSPALWWAEQGALFADITVGETGEGAVQVAPEPVPELTEEEQLQLWRATVTISPFQAHTTLYNWGLYDQVKDLVEAIGPPVSLAFERAIEWRRNGPTITGLFSELTLPGGGSPTEEDLDQFFREALLVEA
jgi:hypothetical protein